MANTTSVFLASRLCDALPHRKIPLVERGIPRNSTADFLVQAPQNFLTAYTSPLVSELFATLPNAGLDGRVVGFGTGNTLEAHHKSMECSLLFRYMGQLRNGESEGLSSTAARRFYLRAFHKLSPATQTGALKNKYSGTILEAAARASIEHRLDPFDETARNSIYENFVTVDQHGVRTDSCTAYIKPVFRGKCARNLKIIQGATVSRVLIKSSQRRACTSRIRY